jgi:hypothetical protein
METFLTLCFEVEDFVHYDLHNQVITSADDDLIRSMTGARVLDHCSVLQQIIKLQMRWNANNLEIDFMFEMKQNSGKSILVESWLFKEYFLQWISF